MSVMSRILPNERTRHVVIAAVIAFVMASIGLLTPVDRMIWLIESRFNQIPTSGEFVFVEASQDLTDPTRPERRVELAQSLSQLQKLGAERIVVDMVFDQASTPEADEYLSKAIATFGDTLVLKIAHNTDPKFQGESGASQATIAEIAGSATTAVDSNATDFLGFVWDLNHSEMVDGDEIPSVASILAGSDKRSTTKFYIDYNFDRESIKTIPILALAGATGGQNLKDAVAGKTIVVGHSANVTSGTINVPGYRRVPHSLVSIFAAETLLRGTQQKISTFPLLIAFMIALFVVVQFSATRSQRRSGYWLISFGLVAFFGYCHWTGTAPYLGHSIGFLTVFAAMRYLANRRGQQLLFDSGIGLPSFVALERDLAKTGNVRSTAIVVAKLHRFDEVTSALSDAATAEYVQQIASRFRIADHDLQVYTKGGKYLAWMSETLDHEMLESHLRGLRAVFAHPLLVRDLPIDVGITFAADLTAEDNAARKIASANSTVEKTTEAHEPVLFAELASEGDRWWSISLQAKIDEALEQGHIYVVFQPKLNVRLGTVVGAEALVRWKDPERGNIAPNYFIEQCENAGRMDHLTRHVLRESLLAAQDFARTSSQFTVSVNISATMLRDYRVAEMVEEILEKTGFNPRNLVLEITETSRIADYDIAYDVMSRLRLHGIKLSIDDFGVGSASMETLLRLPFDELKIDRAFIARMHDDQKARAISQMMIAFGKQTRITVVAEGVEDEANMKLLRDLGCEIVQGYHISKPLEKEKFSQFQSDNQREFSKQALIG